MRDRPGNRLSGERGTGREGSCEGLADTRSSRTVILSKVSEASSRKLAPRRSSRSSSCGSVRLHRRGRKTQLRSTAGRLSGIATSVRARARVCVCVCMLRTRRRAKDAVCCV